MKTPSLHPETARRNELRRVHGRLEKGQVEHAKNQLKAIIEREEKDESAAIENKP